MSVSTLDPTAPSTKATRALLAALNVSAGERVLDAAAESNLRGLPATSFDVAYLNAGWHGLADPARLLKDIFRLLRPLGRLGIAAEHGGERRLSVQDVEALLIKTGLKPVLLELRPERDANGERCRTADGKGELARIFATAIKPAHG
ncbi:MAG: methyltransferase domain-containing protein [Aquabacterium sp.]|jgi:SAM-dependent methyltransferase|nr:MAG: methyltransferase domain-containing protein [Aquabacterium sp.]